MAYKLHTVNENYFEIIDNHKKAYWLGFICADGYISKKNYLKITLKDLEVLEKFVRDIETTYPIRTYTYIDKRTGNSHVEYEVQITNRKFTSYIITHGVTHDKTNVLNFPNINEEYYPSFIAGLIDGDGSVYLKTHGTKHLCLNLVATKEILESIINWLQTKYDIPPVKITKIKGNTINVYKSYWSKYAKNILDIVYSIDPDMYLQRKYQRYINNRHVVTKGKFKIIHQFDSNGNHIQSFNSIADARLKLNLKLSNIRDSANRRIKCEGFYWIYDGEYEINSKIDIKLWQNEIKSRKKEIIIP